MTTVIVAVVTIIAAELTVDVVMVTVVGAAATVDVVMVTVVGAAATLDVVMVTVVGAAATLDVAVVTVVGAAATLDVAVVTVIAASMAAGRLRWSVYASIVTLSVGATLGRYELVRELGSGGMGVVWLAKHRELGTRVAIKALRPEVMNDKEAVTRFDREARAAASLQGPNVARILDVGRDDAGAPFMVMEYLEGNDLGAEIQSRGPLPIAEAVDYVQQACEAMIEAHERGIIHRDLKPENLFLARVGDVRMVKILDFGISRVAQNDEMRVTQTQSSFGTPLYMSPEQVRSTKNVDHRTDIWSLGVIFYEIVTGDPPFTGETPTAVAVAITIDRLVPLREKRRDVPEALEAVIGRAIERDPSKRFQSMRALGEALEPFRNVESAPVSMPRRSAFSMANPSSVDGASTSKTLRVSNTEVPTGGVAKRSPPFLVGVTIGLAAACLAAGVIAFRHTKPETQTASRGEPAVPSSAPAEAPIAKDPPTTSANAALPPTPPVEVSPTASSPTIAQKVSPAPAKTSKPAEATHPPAPAPPPVAPPPVAPPASPPLHL